MRMPASSSAVALALSFGLLIAGCESSRIEGTYIDATGTIVLELKKGGKARFTDPTRSEECKYSVGTDTIPVTCPAGEHIFALGQDRSLTTPSITGALKKMP
jgi:hypothetical protein